jgi:hypothetical protein
MDMLEIAVRSIGPDPEGTNSNKPALLADEAYTPDFFDHWMEDYASKVENVEEHRALNDTPAEAVVPPQR